MTDVSSGTGAVAGFGQRWGITGRCVRNGYPVSDERLAVSPIPLCLFEFRFALVCLLVFMWNTGLTVEVQAQDLV